MDVADLYAAGHARHLALAELLTEADGDVATPACPDWTVRDLLSHLVGFAADVAAGDEPDDHNDEWTGRQVATRRHRSPEELLAEWADLADPLREWMRTHTTRPLNDIVIHEQDLRGALGTPGGRATPGLGVVRDRMLGRFAGALDDLPPVELVGDDWQWCSAGGADDASVVVAAGDFDLARALMSRRSATQLRAWTARGEVTPYLPAFATLGALPDVEQAE